MSGCPICSEPDGQFVGKVVAGLRTGQCQQTNSYRCTRCEIEWQDEHKQPESFHPLSATDFELTEADAVYRRLTPSFPKPSMMGLTLPRIKARAAACPIVITWSPPPPMRQLAAPRNLQRAGAVNATLIGKWNLNPGELVGSVSTPRSQTDGPRLAQPRQ
jgi:hypothetical protein